MNRAAARRVRLATAVSCGVAVVLGGVLGTGVALRAQESLPIVFTGHVLLSAEIRSARGWLLLDPVRGVLLDDDWARGQGIPLLDGPAAGLGRRVFAGGAGAARHEAFFARDVDVRIGPSRAAALRTVVPLDRPMAASIGHRVAGFMGLDVFGDAIVEISVADQRLRLHDRERPSIPSDAMAVPVTWDESIRPLIVLRLTLPSGEEVKLRTYLDLGMAGALRLTTRFVNERRLLPLLCEARAPAAVTRDEHGLGGSLTSVRTRVPAVTVPGVAGLSNVAVTLARETEGADAAPAWDALAGWELLRRFDLWFDRHGARLWMRPHRGVTEPFGTAESGMRFRPLRSAVDALTIASVTRGSAADDAGLRNGDRLVSVDGATVGGRDVARVRRTLQLDGDEPRRIVVERGATALTVQLRPRDRLQAGGACGAP